MVANAGSCRPMTAVDPGNAKSGKEIEAVKMIEPRIRNDRKARATFDPGSNSVALMMHQISSSCVDELWVHTYWLNQKVPF